MNIFILLMSLISFKTYANSTVTLKPFLTDYCTAYPEGTRDQPELWKHCCIEHDLYFWAGGSREDRKETDLRLKACVEATGEVEIARLIYAAVTIGGASPIRFKTKEWGHAFEGRERYLPLSAEETTMVMNQLDQQETELTPEMKNSFYEQLNSRLDLK